MSQQNRSTLKGYFKEGFRPDSDDFADLIDSTLNIYDDGFDKKDKEGLCIRSRVDEHGLLAFYRHQSGSSVTPGQRGAEAPVAGEPQWATAFHGTDNQLVFRQGGPTGPTVPLVTLDPRARVGINHPDPKWTFDVAGVMSSQGRVGAGQRVPADGDWKDITPPLTGCRAYEVMAGVGRPNSGHFALLHAVALNTHNPAWWEDLFFSKRRIRKQHAYYKRLVDRLQLRWTWSGNGANATYRLQIKSGTDYAQGRQPRGKGDKRDPQKEVLIQIYLTDLWPHPDMQCSDPKYQEADRSGHEVDGLSEDDER